MIDEDGRPILRRTLLAGAVGAIIGGRELSAQESYSDIKKHFAINDDTQFRFTIGGGPPKEPPACDRPSECRFSAGMSTTTLLAPMPLEYDREGRIISPTPKPINTTMTLWSCRICGRVWGEEELS